MTTPDPRPRVEPAGDGAVVVGLRCESCRHPLAVIAPRCPVCGLGLREERFAGSGEVWSSTVLRIPLAGRESPTVLAYVDLDDGPRVLAHASGSAALTVGSRVRVAGVTAHGDPLVELLSSYPASR